MSIALILCIGIFLFLILNNNYLDQGSADVSGAFDAPGVSENEILIGTSNALTGHASFLGTQTMHGAISYINHVNDNGGVHGKNITLISYDDQYDPPQTIANTKKLIEEDEVFALFSYVGTPTSVVAKPILEEAGVPLVGLFTGASVFRDPASPYIFNIRASYYQEIQEVISHLVEELNMKKIAVFYQNDAYGLDGLKSAEDILKGYDLTPASTGSFERGTLEIEDALKSIKSASPEAVIMIGTYSPCAKFIKLAKKEGLNALFHNVSFVGAEALKEELGESGEGVIITQVVPPPIDEIPLPAIVEYQELLAQYFPSDKPDFVGLEGYLNAKVLVKALEDSGKNLTRESFINALNNLNDFSVGIGSNISFSESDHQGLDEVYATQIRDGELIFFSSWKELTW
ncbi:ABC transporter substrate-binding protein [Candidatus Peregrinibacteria bacterium]|nr:ABC transporter substrate-binding protein [Candidatus Peregrinibacteria bacterium]